MVSIYENVYSTACTALHHSVVLAVALAAQGAWTTEGRVFAQSLPAPWESRDIGGPKADGSATYQNGTFTVTASGDDIAARSDQFHFVYQQVAGDAEVVARVDDVTKADAWSKTGVMIRSSLKDDASHAFVLVSAGKGLAFRSRSANGGSTGNVSGGSGSAPRWVRLARSGGKVTASTSGDGVAWTTIGAADIKLGSTAYVGLATTSDAGAAVTRARLSEVAVHSGSLPDGLKSKDIGKPKVAGRALHSNGTFRVSGAGEDIRDARDEFHYVYRAVVGDVDLRVRVASIQNIDQSSKAGVMIRESLADDSSHAMAFTSAGRGYAFRRRAETGHASDNTDGGPGTAPGWVRLVRSGTLIEAYRSADGESWSSMGSDVILLPETVYVGVAVTSNRKGSAAEGVFNNLSITALDSGPNQPPSVSLTAPADGTSVAGSTSVAVTANASDPDGSIARVEFFDGNFEIGADATAPYSVSWTALTAGTRSLSAIAYDDQGASTRSATITVTVQAAAGHAVPILLTAPSNGATFAGPATITMSAAPAVAASPFARMDFFANGALVGSDASSPYSVVWQNAPAGTYSLTAVAYDGGSGFASTSPASVVTVTSTGASPMPKLVVFEQSPDDGKVKRYVLEIFAAGASPASATALATSDLGKPKGNPKKEITVDRSAFFLSLPPGTYVATVRAENAAGFNRSVGVTFTR